MGRDSDDEDYVEEIKKSRVQKKQKLSNSRFKEDGYDENFIGDEEDQKRLDQMTEIDRESIIQERREQRQKMEEEAKVRQEYEKNQAKKQLEQKKQNMESLQKQKYGHVQESDSSSNPSDEEGQVQGYGQDDDYDEDDDSDKNDQGNKIQRQSKKEQEYQQELKKNLERITMTRDQLENIYQRTNFSELVQGCFVRARSDYKQESSGSQQYVFSKILRVEQGIKYYSLPNGQTNLLLVLHDGKIERQFQIRYVSNQQVTEEEFTNWIESKSDQKMTIKQINKVLLQFNQKKQNNSVDSRQIMNEKLKKIRENLQNDVPMSRVDIIKAIEIIEDKLGSLAVKIAHHEEIGDFSNDNYKNCKLNQASIEKLLEKLKQKKKQVQTENVFKSHQFQQVHHRHIFTQQQKKKSKSKDDARIKKLNELNMKYMQEIQMNQKFAHHEKAEQLKQSFKNLHNRPLPNIDQAILSWTPLDYKDLLGENKP